MTTNTLKRWSNLKGLAVVTIDTGTKVGTLDDFFFDPQTNQVRAFLIKTGLFSHRTIMTTDINAVGTDAVTCSSEGSLVKQPEALETITARGQDLLHYRVLSEGGTVVGTVGDIVFDFTDPRQPVIASFELAGNLFAHLSKHLANFSAQHIIRYGQDVMVIPDTVAQTLR